MKKQYSHNERILNIINRAVKEFCFEFDVNDTLQEIGDGAENCLQRNIKYDRIEVCEFDWKGRYQHLFWSDDMGYSTDQTGDIISGEQRDWTWFRWDDEKREYVQIDWYKSTEDDYVLADYQIDSEGQVVCLIAK